MATQFVHVVSDAKTLVIIAVFRDYEDAFKFVEEQTNPTMFSIESFKLN